jgi:hypothetical protein
MKTQTATKQTFVKITAISALGLAVALLAAGCASLGGSSPPAAATYNVASYKTVAVEVKIPNTSTYLAGNNVHRDEALSAMASVVSELLLQKGYTVMERADMDRIIQEQKLQGSGYTASQAAEFGDAASGRGLFIVTLTSATQEWKQGEQGQQGRYEYKAKVTIQLNDALKGTRLWSKSSGGGMFGTLGSMFGDSSNPIAAIENEVRAVAKQIPAQQ